MDTYKDNIIGVRSQESGVRSQESGVRSQRNSALELLRIVAMLMIVSCHVGQMFFYYFSMQFRLPFNISTINTLWGQFITMGGALGNDIFILISGYFLAKSHEAKPMRLLNLWLRIFFYSVTFFLIFTISGLEPFSIKTMLQCILPVVKNQWWFMTAYFVIYIFHPYINIFLRAMSHDEYKKFLITLVLCWCIIPTVFKSYYQERFVTLVCLYFIAGYIRLWADDFGSKKFIWLGFGSIAINYLSIVTFDLLGVKIPYFVGQTYFLCGMMGPFTVFGTVSLLIGFKHLHIHSRLLNLTASAVLGVYLIHMNRFVWPFIRENCKALIFSVHDSPYLIPCTILAIFLVYISCTVIEIMRSKIFKTLSRGRLS
ncbi:MAG: acyltransferase [Synergistaceae bacterium]|nr:acyltransferase [Synergistaceae bacterium]